MSSNKFDLHEERLSTTDEHGHRVYLYPEDVKGIWRHRRTIFYWFLIFIFLVLPWIHFHGKQIILLDIGHREFTFFGTTFFAHDAPMMLLVFLVFLFTMGLITSIWGRVWCGWACPQTVFIDAIYRKIELLIEGRARQREKLDLAPLSISKFFKKTLKWSLYLLVSLHISHSFLGYFVGTRELLEISMHAPSENWELFLTMSFLTVLVLFDFGWFREQFCIIACPYGRIQSVMMDDNSLVVAYDKNRGEPHKQKDVPPEKQGDCVNCYACVRACPTGIDIRRGTQLECIACTNCIDACDEIMIKVHKPTGLIRYDRQNNLEGKPVRKFGVRQGIYSLAILASLIIFVISIFNSQLLKVHFIRGKTPYMAQANNIVNQYKLTLDYKNEDRPHVEIKIENEDMIQIATPFNPMEIKYGHQVVNLFFKFDKSILDKGSKKIKINFEHTETKEILTSKELTLVGPIE